MPRVLSLALVLGLAACSEPRPAPDLSRVQLGMSEAEVTALTGAPRDIQRAACGPRSPTYFVYEGRRESIDTYVLFIGDDVAQVVVDRRVLVSASDDVLAGCASELTPPG